MARVTPILRGPLAWAAVCLALAGCLSSEVTVPRTTTNEEPFELYEYRWEGDSTADEGTPVGWALRIVHPGNDTVILRMETDADRHGPVGLGGWNASTGPVAQIVAPGKQMLWFFEAEAGSVVTTTLRYEVSGIEVGHTVLERSLGTSVGRAVEPDMHVLTKTVGLWLNGTSFYTNIAELNSDPAFPAGYDRSTFGGDPLPVYVYDQDRSEQPARSKDTCHFTTIPGYNDLLRQQQEFGTNVRFLSPEEGYTRRGNEDHFLYGDALVFVNTVVAVEGTTGEEDQIPDPTGECFDIGNHAPVPPV